MSWKIIESATSWDADGDYYYEWAGWVGLGWVFCVVIENKGRDKRLFIRIIYYNLKFKSLRFL